jgi:hypothetical protein
VTAIAAADCRVLRFDREILEASASRDTPGGIQVTEIRTDDELLREATVRRLSFSDAQERKGAIWIDVRL